MQMEKCYLLKLFQEWGRGGKRRIVEEWIQVWYIWYIVRTFRNATMYPYPVKGKWRSQKERHSKKEFATFRSSRSLLGRVDLKVTFGLQSNTLRGDRVHLQAGVFSHFVAGKQRLEGDGH
jgi:hypothetical protein